MMYEEKIEQLSNEILALKAELALSQARNEHYAEAYDSLKAQIMELRRHRFGKRSERYIDPENPQLSLFENNQSIFSQAEASGEQTEEMTPVAAHTRKKNKKAQKELPRRIEIIPVSDEDKQCACGACKTVIRYETKELLHYQPCVIEIVEQRREVVACTKGCENQIVTAAAPKQILPKIKATEEFLSFLVVSKLDDRQPLYHLERQLSERHGIDCSRQTMARWLIELMTPLRPIYNLLKDSVIEYDVASCDATTLQVLHEPGRKAETKSYVYCIRGGPPDKSVILYDYNDVEHKQFIYDWFVGFNGYLHVDGDNFFELVGSSNAHIVNCNAHARRKFEPIAQSNKGKGIAKEAMRFFKELYKIEREAKNNQLNPDQRHQLRQEKSKPLMEAFNTWVDKVYPTTLPQSPLGKALNYCVKYRDGLMRFLDDGRLEIDNNLTEQEIKPLVIARKNFLFCASVEGAEALCLHFSIIRTAKLHNLDPYHYYVMLLKNAPLCNSVDDYEKLLPWNIGLDYTPKL
ncbi:IS66 family transposase [Legionella sp. PATHC038]|uniref:IS66 family transposase n=3 Tax=Legionella sheltonii TaxID=2992041 RepID=UPI0022442B66|nr:IS66 family transposase [Legionella sp. PATHC038]MCW8397632.1 IS66 family transposase [Legionella sp. PATHC038]MCW8398048.1 IS66 family transposase [Legionella sp. PATHC038]MCW8398963.1 IS66 family transposase [Legionella sp. PATHC038]MCW8398969.1 IS66 family transposase [Legionella sp. PATHC038]MCW8399076.1 IS66 family transposase [Legionella sp. PATHC038]